MALEGQEPIKFKMFGWLLLVDRLNTRNMLKRRHYVVLDNNYACMLCQNPPEEIVEHLFFSCPAARRILHRLGLRLLAMPIADLFSTTLPPTLPDTVRPFMLLLFLWKIWDARNKKVFQNIELDASQTLVAILDDLITWSHRLRTETLRGHAGLWRDFLSSRNL